MNQFYFDSLPPADDHATVNHFGKGPIGYKISDDHIWEDVCECLFRDRMIDASEIEVSVISGVVTLEGKVESKEQKDMATECAKKVSFVKEVNNHLKIEVKGLVRDYGWA